MDEFLDVVNELNEGYPCDLCGGMHSGPEGSFMGRKGFVCAIMRIANWFRKMMPALKIIAAVL